MLLCAGLGFLWDPGHAGAEKAAIDTRLQPPMGVLAYLRGTLFDTYALAKGLV